jgi:DNA-binding IclR family transcriptional regulator
VSVTRVDRIAHVLEFLASPDTLRSPSDIARELQLAPSSTHDLLKSMAHAKLVVANDDRQYSLAPRAIRLGMRIAAGADIGAVTRRHVPALVETIRQDVYVATRTENTVIYAESFHGPQPIRIGLRLGDPVSLHSTAVGKLFAAFDPAMRSHVLSGPLSQRTEHTLTSADDLRRELDEIRLSGVSVSREENVRGIVAIAVPVCDSDERVIEALAVSALAGDMPDVRVPEVVAEALATARSIEDDLGFVRSD